MTNILKKAIFVVMALVMSSSIVFGQNDVNYSSASNPSGTTVTVHASYPPINHIDDVIETAIMDYRWKYDSGWSDWQPEPAAFITWEEIRFYATDQYGATQFEYKIRTYNASFKLVRSTCGVVDINGGADNHVYITTWNRCLGDIWEVNSATVPMGDEY